MSDALDAIAAEAAAETGGGPGAEALGADQPAQLAAGDEEKIAMWAMVPTVAGKVLCMGLPELRPVYSPEACREWGVAMLAVAKKYGWDLGANAPEFMLIAASTTFILPTAGAVIARKRAAKEGDKGPGGDVTKTPAPAGTVDQLGAVNDTPAK